MDATEESVGGIEWTLYHDGKRAKGSRRDCGCEGRVASSDEIDEVLKGGMEEGWGLVVINRCQDRLYITTGQAPKDPGMDGKRLARRQPVESERRKGVG